MSKSLSRYPFVVRQAHHERASCRFPFALSLSKPVLSTVEGGERLYGTGLSLLVYTLLFLLLSPTFVSAHSISEVVNAPATFDQQPVSVFGEVANMTTRYGDSPYTTFDLLDVADVALPVFIWGKPAFKQGDLCHVIGTFVQERTLGSQVLVRGVEADRVEKVSEAEYKTAGQLFRKKRKANVGPGGKYPKGFYVPQE